MPFLSMYTDTFIVKNGTTRRSFSIQRSREGEREGRVFPLLDHSPFVIYRVSVRGEKRTSCPTRSLLVWTFWTSRESFSLNPSLLFQETITGSHLPVAEQESPSFPSFTFSFFTSDWPSSLTDQVICVSSFVSSSCTDPQRPQTLPHHGLFTLSKQQRRRRR